jgi:hypothetical protein
MVGIRIKQFSDLPKIKLSFGDKKDTSINPSSMSTTYGNYKSGYKNNVYEKEPIITYGNKKNKEYIYPYNSR